MSSPPRLIAGSLNNFNRRNHRMSVPINTTNAKERCARHNQ
jgi:hypothetical protein